MDGGFDDFDITPFGSSFQSSMSPASYASQAAYNMFKGQRPPPHSSHPNFAHLCILVLQAVLEVVFVAFPGYILARMGVLDQRAQKMISHLNVNLFTPALSE